MRFAAITPYHRMMAYLGIGDLHPGGAEITARLLGWLDGIEVHNVLEIGSGMGLSTRRLASRGWTVVAVERDEVLRRRLKDATVVATLEEALPFGPFDAVIAESVLYGMPQEEALPLLSQLLRPGGALVFCDMLWSSDATAETCAHWHVESLSLFGIAMVPRTPLTWAHMRDSLCRAGFRIEAELRFALNASPTGSPFRWGRVVAALAWRPRLAIDWLRHQRRMKRFQSPSHLLENWAGMAVKRPNDWSTEVGRGKD